MSQSVSRLVLLLLSAGVVCLSTANGPSAGQSVAGPPDLVPVNVEVLDKAGKPVTDLTQADFTVFENGASQRIQRFEPLAFGAGEAASEPVLPLRTQLAASVQTGRIFVVVFGTGRLEAPTRGLTNLLNFMKTRLLPQDRVALVAHDRALPFTTDHKKVVEVLERVKKSHEDVDFVLGQEMGPTGMAPLYGSRAIPKKLRTKIDELLHGPGAAPVQRLSTDEIDQRAFRDLSLDTFMASCATTLRDPENLRAVLEYLRRYQGQKHVLFVTEKGFLWPEDSGDQAIASTANDARVTIHTMQTGGMLTATDGKELTATQQQARSLRSLRRIAEMTGGLTSVVESGALLDKMDAFSRAGYLIGYQASSGGWDATYRNIVVTVKRPDVTVYHRRGYYRIPEAGQFNRRTFITNDRIGAAVAFRREVSDLKVKASVSVGGNGMEIKGKITLSKVSLTTVDGMRVGQLNVGVFGLDNGGNPMGGDTQVLPLKLSEEEYARARKDGYVFSIQFPVISGAQQVRFIVYDFGSDLVGRVDMRIG